jgi:alpha-L-rhamnosidase
LTVDFVRVIARNSFNHYSLGSVAQWLYEHVAGIRTDPERPGYAHVVIAPEPGELEHAEATFRSVRGPIRSAWRRTGGRFELTVEVPANVTATVVLPSADEVTAPGIEVVRGEDGRWVAEVGSGEYELVARLAGAA